MAYEHRSPLIEDSKTDFFKTINIGDDTNCFFVSNEQKSALYKWNQGLLLQLAVKLGFN